MILGVSSRMAPMSRLFVALETPGHVKDVLESLDGGLPGARWVPRDQRHLTLDIDSLPVVINYDLPMVVMTPSGSGIRGSLYHSHSFESWASYIGTNRDYYG